MNLFFETLLVREGRIPFLPWHLERAARTRKRVFGLSGALAFPALPKECRKGTWRMKVVYGKKAEEVLFQPYRRNLRTNLRTVESDLEYTYKSADRKTLDTLFQQRGDADDVLIVKNGRITDTTIANIAFFDGRRWITPAAPLLRGTARERLIRSRFLTPEAVPVRDLHERFKLFGLMNALTGFYVAGPVDQIRY